MIIQRIGINPVSLELKLALLAELTDKPDAKPVSNADLVFKALHHEDPVIRELAERVCKKRSVRVVRI